MITRSQNRWLPAILVIAGTTIVLAQSAPVINDSLAGRQVFPVSNWWNLDVRSAPVDANSRQYIDFISKRTASTPTAIRKLHPDFGPPPYGIPYVVVSGSEPLVPVQFVAYPGESDTGAPGRPPGYPLPDEARTQTGYIEGNVAGGGSSGDRHLLVIDRDNWLLYETFATRWNSTAWRWEADSGAVFDLASNARRPDGWTSADAAGLAIFPGLVRYDEIEAPGEIRHAFRVTVRATNGLVWPASHRAGSTAGAPPMGARLRLKATKDLTPFPAYIQKIFRAMQTYGLIVADNGSDMYISGTMDARWNNDQLNPAFAALTADDFDVLQLGYGAPTAAPALSLTMTDAPDPVAPGNDFTYSLVVRNDGGTGATGVVVNDTLPASVSLISTTATQGSCSGVTAVSCALGSLASGKQAAVTFTVRALQAGSVSNSASVKGNEPEVDMSNNSASVTTTVTAPPPPRVTTHVGELVGSRTSINRRTWRASVRATVHDAQHALLAGAVVTGRWSGGFSGTSSCTTDASGGCTMSSGTISTRNGETFTVTRIAKTGTTYDAAQNHKSSLSW